MGHSDPALTYLKQYGYSVVRLPRADITPLLLLAPEGKSLNRLGAVHSLFQAGVVQLPEVKENTPAADIKGSIKTTVSLGLGLSLLGNFLQAMGGKAFGLDVAYKKANQVTFEFSALLSDSIEVTDLDKFLNTAEVDHNSRHVAELLEGDEVYVVTTTLKTKQFTVDAQADGGVKVAVSIPSIKQIVGGDVSVTRDSSNDSKVGYVGSALLVFGFSAVRLEYQNGRGRGVQLPEARGR